MGQLWKFLLGQPQLILIFVAVSISLIGRIAKSLGQQAEKRRRELARERAEAEALRTGRAPGASPEPQPPQVSARAQLEDIASRRRAAMSSPLPPTNASAPAPRSTVQSGKRVASQFDVVLSVPNAPTRLPPATPHTQRTAAVPAPSRQMPRQQRPQRSIRPAGTVAQSSNNRRRKPSQPDPVAFSPLPAVPQAPASTAASVAAQPRPQATPPDAIRRNGPGLGLEGTSKTTRSELRRAIILREVLDAPLSMR